MTSFPVKRETRRAAVLISSVLAPSDKHDVEESLDHDGDVQHRRCRPRKCHLRHRAPQSWNSFPLILRPGDGGGRMLERGWIESLGEEEGLKGF